ncbi:unnamed protein product [Durusdinium trenchii]
MAGARSNIGLKSGRYVFEVKIIESVTWSEEPSAKSRMQSARSQVRLGLATAASLFLGEDQDSICFDSQGSFYKEKRKVLGVSQKFTTGDVVALLVNLDSTSPNAFTVSLFKDGQRATPPQPLPDCFRGKALYPALSFRNVALHYNFGPLLVPLPFTCRVLKDASAKDATVKRAHESPHEVIFPVALPDEGGFDWLDQFLESNPSFTEVSDRALLKWCERSGIHRPKGYGASARSSNDKPEMGFGIAALDEINRRLLQVVCSFQKRNLVVMEVKANLLKSDRKELTARWPGFKRVAAVVVGDPPVSFKSFSQEAMLRMKQEALTAEFKAKAQEERKKASDKPLDPDDEAKKVQETLKRKADFERRKREAEMKGENFEEEEEGDVDLEAKKRKECERKTEISILRFDRVTKFLSKRGSLYFGFGANKRNNVRLISKMNTKQRSN